ncbi:DNA gyrase subunit A [Hydrogenobacter thermophilus TK-6]|uniref:Uncharacterized protein n=1 Tax=Hydrogenobacter thermophilus (strain DSM 6534 / IAM 12695 / TK-6) TaxID=608538 RepID=D3DGN2_HYDTT|nr:hypothetical protein [Hydrogenobacter thermophilus]ADO44918.1 DNA gyrase subunit A [Hydrogenobacter thermophilus TK-6]BAI68984.1 hypothetical protein HTH_0520 [Hydrogenobacter thermophilus TK-6]
MLKRIRSIKDGWEMTLSLFAVFASLVVLVLSLRLQAEAQRVVEENQYLRYHLVQVCKYIDTLPKRERVVFDVCLEVGK